MQVQSKSSYQFPGVFKTSLQQQLYFTSDVSQLVQSFEDLYFTWKDIQLSKSPLNKDHLIEMEIQGKKVSLFYRSSPCAGLKVCPISECCHVVPMWEKRNCPTHNMTLTKTTCCLIDFVYLYPKDSTDQRRWFGGLVRSQNKQPATCTTIRHTVLQKLLNV